MKRVFSIVGARPQFVKAAVVAHSFARQERIDHQLIHTGQHYDDNMSEIFFRELGMAPPLYRLSIGGLSHGAMTGRMLEQIEDILVKDRPDAVIVYGDTNTTVASALAAVKLHIPVAHVEAGLRSFNRRMPEEINRIATDHISDLLFAPNDKAVRQLIMEGVPAGKIENVGDVMLDACLCYSHFEQDGLDVLNNLNLRPLTYALATLHRAENTDSREALAGILEGLRLSEMPIVLPIHPRTRARIAGFGFDMPSNVRVIAPIGFRAMLQLERNAICVVTDSGGVQKEAFFMRRPCVTIRDQTEWTELVDAGWNVLVGSRPQQIKAAIRSATPPEKWPPLFGDGNASGKIVAGLLPLLGVPTKVSQP